MKPQNLHAHEDRLLDFAYGELPAHEARAVESHLQGCTRCSELLDGIRGVRSTMAQLPMEPAPDAGLDSLLAYAQQAARNAAAGPALKPTWWRRWLMPAMGVTAVSIFGLVTLQVSKSVNLEPDLALAERATKKEEPSPLASALPAPATLAEPAAPPPPSQAQPAQEVAAGAPAPSEPVAKLDADAFDKLDAAPRKKAMKSKLYAGDSDWSNSGLGASRALERDESKDYDYDRRDAMTQSGAFSKPKPMLLGKGAASGTARPSPAPASPPPPPPAAAQPGAAPADEPMNEGASMDDGFAASEAAPAQQQGPSRGSSLRLGGTRRGTTEAAAEKEAEVASLGSAPPQEAKREQRAQASAATPAPQSAGSAAPVGRAERQSPSPEELSKLALAAMRSDDRVREAQYLRQALEAGATGKERLGLLNRLCDAEFSIGRRQAAIEACSLVIEEDPRSSAAQVARRRLSQEAPQAKPDTRFSAPKTSAPMKADEREAPASAPAQAP